MLPAIEAGATGYLLKDAPRSELLRAVRAAANGEAVLSPAVAAKLMSRVRSPGAGPLSQRELEVLELVASGTTNRQAAAGHDSGLRHSVVDVALLEWGPGSWGSWCAWSTFRFWERDCDHGDAPSLLSWGLLQDRLAQCVRCGTAGACPPRRGPASRESTTSHISRKPARVSAS